MVPVSGEKWRTINLEYHSQYDPMEGIMKHLLSIVLMTIFLPSLAQSQDCLHYGNFPHLIATAETPGIAVSVALSGNYAYVGDYSVSSEEHFHVIDISDPENATIVGSLEVLFRINSVAISGNQAYVVGDSYLPSISRMMVIDISDPTTPVSIGEMDLSGVGFGVAVAGDFAYVASGDEGLLVVDISDPANLSPMGIVVTPDAARGLVVDGTTVFLAANEAGLLIIDVGDPQNPTIIGSIPSTSYSVEVALSGNHCFVADGLAGLTIVDISNPSIPVSVASLVTDDSAIDVFVSGDWAYVADHSGGMKIVDISDPSIPLIVGRVATGSSSQELEIAGDHAFVAARNSGLQVINLGNRSQPQLLGSTEAINLKDVDISGTHAFVVGAPGLLAVDIEDFQNPQVVGEVAVSSTTGISCTVHGSLALVTRNYFDSPWGPSEPGGLDVIDISDPTNLQMLGSVDTDLVVLGVAAQGNYAYIACSGYSTMPPPGSFQVVDISDPENPWITGSVQINTAYDVAVEGNTAYVAGGTEGLIFVDISDPFNPEIVESIVTAEFPVSVVVKNNYAYLAGDGLSIVELDQNNGGTLVGRLALTSLAQGVSVSGDTAYLVNGSSLYVVDVSDAHNPLIIGSRVGHGFNAGVALSNELVLGASPMGLQILPLQCDSQVSSVEESDTEGLLLDTAFSVHPNPFNPRVTVSFHMEQPQMVKIGVYDVTGRRVAVLSDSYRESGEHLVQWMGTDHYGRSLASGTYFIRMSNNSGVSSHKVQMIR